MDKQTVVPPYSGTLPSNKREQAVNTCNNVDEPQGHYAEGKKPVSRGYILYDSIYMAFSRDEFIVMKNRSEVARAYGWREGCDLERVVGGRFCLFA